ncbi:NtaA/DmoA family FMN-dependent monooxygenase [Streptomyces rishiriensis]|uniref:FMN-dependent oxidoreductase (Nitrilotriacetate monooxygenase family) n=1 Tax=Streptomyces rishiriensis TaxID=68264 RepID=A0ABU0NLQ3_STRRH|nr:NtaA/DmoA family FMN-dependent monooxygenase [Streptomyces rishiriensis]MDQ0580056.1 FMN-dependent oxidoreductase (nitrilotriacetate monooxygenase family) [Streptomyces rishiriensis]
MSGRRPRGPRPPGAHCHLAACFPDADTTTVWTGPAAGSPIEFSSFEHLARTAERGLFDFLLLAEGPRPREQQGPVHDRDVAGRPEPLTVLNALAAVTERLGLAATADTTFHEPFELARRLATLDHLSGGRAAWRVAASAHASTGENFRRGDYLERAERYPRAAEFIATARRLWDSWTPDGASQPFAHQGRHFDIAGEFTVPRPPQGHPVVIRTGRSGEARECAAATADVVLAPHGTLEAGRAFYADVKGRLAKYGRTAADLKIMPGVTVVLGDTAAEAQERAATIRRRLISPQRAVLVLERLWGVDLSAYDPDGPLPEFDPVADPRLTRDLARHGDAVATAGKLRALSKEKGLSIRQTVIETSARQSFIGTPEAVAAELAEFVREGAADGFVLVPQLTPDGLDEFVDRVVPLLQERGVFRTEYEGHTLRSHLGLPVPAGDGRTTPSPGT